MVFEDLFRESGGKPVVYKGQILVLGDEFPTAGMARFKLTLEHFGSNWKQGVRMSVDSYFLIDCEKIITPVAVWQNIFNRELSFEVAQGTRVIRVKNVWDTGNGITDSGTTVPR